MPIFWIYIIVSIIAAVFSGKIDKAAHANGKLRRLIIIFDIGIVIILSIIIKIAL